jgi:anti-sigma factor RsiW
MATLAKEVSNEMPRTNNTDEELRAYLAEQLPAERMALIEQSLRDSETLRQRLVTLIRETDQGGVTVGEVWRRSRLSCPTRSQLGAYLLGALEDAQREYLDFHLQTVGCRVCEANLADLQQANTATPEKQRRRRRYFESSAGYLRRD